jgi:2,3-bisphosphoglycerate-independent phosphoglycerate mutase
LNSTSEAIRTANLVGISKKAHAILSELEINKKRQAEGLLPANAILLRSAGIMGSIPPVGELFSMKTACIAGDKTILGLTRMAGFDVYTDDRFTGGFDTWIQGKAEKAFNLLQSGYDWVLVHVKATDLAGHDNEPQQKTEIIEKVDEAVGFLLQHLDLARYYIGLTADHSTPCEVGDHSGDPVPTILAGSDVRKDAYVMLGRNILAEDRSKI